MSDTTHFGRLVITGGTGFIGTHVAARARDLGWSVVALGSADIDLLADDAPQRVASILQDGDTLVHSAAIAPTRSSADLCANIRMTQHLVDGLQGIEPAQVIVVSSDAVYGSAAGLLREESPTDADSLHGVMSLGRELLCREIKTPLHTVVRPAPVYGLHDTHNSYGPNRMARDLVASGTVNVFGVGANVRDHVSIDDVAAIIVGAAQHRVSGTLLAASGQSVSFTDLATMVADCRPGSDIMRIGTEPTPFARSYDTTHIVRCLPTLVLTPPSVGVPAMVRAMLAGSDPAGSSS